MREQPSKPNLIFGSFAGLLDTGNEISAQLEFLGSNGGENQFKITSSDGKTINYYDSVYTRLPLRMVVLESGITTTWQILRVTKYSHREEASALAINPTESYCDHVINELPILGRSEDRRLGQGKGARRDLSSCSKCGSRERLLQEESVPDSLIKECSEAKSEFCSATLECKEEIENYCADGVENNMCTCYKNCVDNNNSPQGQGRQLSWVRRKVIARSLEEETDLEWCDPVEPEHPCKCRPYYYDRISYDDVSKKCPDGKIDGKICKEGKIGGNKYSKGTKVVIANTVDSEKCKDACVAHKKGSCGTENFKWPETAMCHPSGKTHSRADIQAGSKKRARKYFLKDEVCKSNSGLSSIYSDRFYYCFWSDKHKSHVLHEQGCHFTKLLPHGGTWLHSPLICNQNGDDCLYTCTFDLSKVNSRVQSVFEGRIGWTRWSDVSVNSAVVDNSCSLCYCE